VTKHLVLKPKEVATVLEKLGFVEARQKGSQWSRYNRSVSWQPRFVTNFIATNREGYWVDY
jgi:hypothetical protein